MGQFLNPNRGMGAGVRAPAPPMEGMPVQPGDPAGFEQPDVMPRRAPAPMPQQPAPVMSPPDTFTMPDPTRPPVGGGYAPGPGLGNPPRPPVGGTGMTGGGGRMPPIPPPGTGGFKGTMPQPAGPPPRPGLGNGGGIVNLPQPGGNMGPKKPGLPPIPAPGFPRSRRY